MFGNEVGERVKDLKRSWRALCQRAGCDDLNFHDLRRECASRWFEGIGPERRGRMPLATVSRLLGHTSIETTFIYLGVKDEALPDDVQRFEEERNRFARVSHTEVNGLSASAKPELAVH